MFFKDWSCFYLKNIIQKPLRLMLSLWLKTSETDIVVFLLLIQIEKSKFMDSLLLLSLGCGNMCSSRIRKNTTSEDAERCERWINIEMPPGDVAPSKCHNVQKLPEMYDHFQPKDTRSDESVSVHE